METRKIIIDTDPGIDDAAAISVMLSEPSLDVKLIASVSGNVGIEHTTNNALKLLTFLKKDVPVAKGAFKGQQICNKCAWKIRYGRV